MDLTKDKYEDMIADSVVAKAAEAFAILESISDDNIELTLSRLGQDSPQERNGRWLMQYVKNVKRPITEFFEKMQ